MLITSERKLRVGDSAVLYVTTCSDIDSSFRFCRRFVECQIIGQIVSRDKKELDDRYIIRCSENLRDEPYKGGLYAYEALVSVHSPFLFTWREFDRLKNNPKDLQKWLDGFSDMMLGYDVPKHMHNWKAEAHKIMLGLGIDEIDGVVMDIESDFTPETMQVIRFL